MIHSETTARVRRATTRTLCAALLASGALLGLCRGASAQYAYEDEILPPRVVAWRLAERGFSGVSRPRFDGRVYVVDAVGPNGVPVRLFVDPAAGAIVGRQPLGAPEAYARVERPGAGFGWTEEDATAPRRIARPVPPDDVPTARPQRRPAGQALRPEFNPGGLPGGPPGGPPDGLNPEGRARPEAPRKVARATPPARQPELKPALRTVPEAPAAAAAPAETAKAGASPETKSAAIEKAPRANPAPVDAARPTEGSLAEAAKPPSQDWKDPPADKKPVRIIGGATIVPGPSEKDSGAAQER